MLEDSQTQVLIHGPEFLETAESVSKDLRWVIQKGGGSGLDYDEFLERGSEREPDVAIFLDDLFDLWYTSGTTGAPKGIMLTHREIPPYIQFLLTDVYDITRQDRFLTSGALSHAGSVRILPFIIRGAACHLHTRFDPQKIFEEIERWKITDLAVVPTMLIALMDHAKRPHFDLSFLKRITYAGSPTPLERIKEALAIFGPIMDQSYGQAESIITITHLPREEHVLKGTRTRKDDLRQWEENTLVSRSGLWMMRIIFWVPMRWGGGDTFRSGHARLLEAARGDRQSPERGMAPYRGHRLSGRRRVSYLFLVDRKHDKIITGRLNVYPREVEEVLCAQAAVFGVEDTFWGEAVTAAVVKREGMALTNDELLTFCKERLAGYKRPKKIHFLDDLPKNLYGEVLRKDLRKRFEGS